MVVSSGIAFWSAKQILRISRTAYANAAKALADRGAVSVSAYVSHGVLSGKACERVEGSVLTELVITDTIEASGTVKAAGKVRQVSVAPLIGEAIRRIANEESVSKLFD